MWQTFNTLAEFLIENMALLIFIYMQIGLIIILMSLSLPLGLLYTLFILGLLSE